MDNGNNSVRSVSEVADYISTSFWGSGQSFPFALGADRVLTVNLEGLPQSSQQIALWGLDAWTTVTGITFERVTGSAQITFDDEQPGAFAGARVSNGSVTQADVNVSQGWVGTYGTEFNSYSTMTYIHEIGHALGLGHPGDYSDGANYQTDRDYANDSWQMSVLSYFSQRDNTFIDATYALVATPMLADIGAIQSLYGDVALRTGNTIYGDGSTAGGTYDRISEARAAGTLGDEVAWAILDDGGYDILDVSSSAANQIVDLRPEAISSVYGITGNLAIERGSIIEEIRTGSGDDLIIGSTNNDRLLGNAGNDEIYLGQGDDFVGGGTGNDLIRAESGANTIYGGAGSDTISGGTGNDTIYAGGNSRNEVQGSDGNDLIYGGSSNDLLAGGTGNDSIYGGVGADTIYLGFGDDVVGGGTGSDLIVAGAGNNEIYGSLGDDTVYGGDGADMINGGEGADLLAGGAGNDSIYGSVGADTIYLGMGDDFAGGGADADQIFAGAGNNEIYGGVGDDTITAGVGRDVSNGGAGADVFVFTTAASAGIGASRDIITDFEVGVDKIDLSAMGLTFGPTGMVDYIPGFVVGDVDSDGTNDFAIQMFGAPALSVDDFIL
ncbi:Serralysin precursor [Roseovarius gaetbuli]|uniref:Serralysin n=1 Tax=Roseovarius gaetbuli TaxID=1356575 RepID=A0A1X6ZJI0_9RHOB|nr:M10 family metallopeptidase C-terminal domain-containing protein [Roseovarius gaetbuli]SLN53014.1 Serralysin precursor [Roseovarius gaetbuli]